MYDDAWMPNMQRITWNGIALHGGPLPGYAASHGCVRMPYGFAEKLFEKTWIGMRVIISPNDAEPVEFSHPALFVPNPEAIAAAPAKAEALAREAAEAARTADEAKKAAATATRETASLTASLRKLEGSRPAPMPNSPRRQGARRRQDGRGQGAGRGPQAEGRRQGRGPGDAARRRQGRRETEARRRRRRKGRRQGGRSQEGRHRQGGHRGEARARAGVDLHQPRDAEALRAAQHAQAWPDGGEVFDATIEVPVTIRDPDKPIGTHVFTAVARNGAGLRWTAVTIDEGDNAKDALDRITIPQDVLDRVAPTAVPLSSIIVSDEPLSKETNYRTEFVAVLSNQPQGGFITRKPTTDNRVANARNDDFFSFNFQRSWDSSPGYTSPRGGQFYGPGRQGWFR